MSDFLKTITKERPTGTPNNESVNLFLENEFKRAGFQVQSLPFECTVWETKKSIFKIGDADFDIEASPFSTSFDGSTKTIVIDSLDKLKKADCSGKIIILCGELTKNQLQPKDFPFYYPDEDKEIISLLEEKKPCAIIAATGKNPMCDLNPFPLFEDGNFMIPSAYLSDAVLPQIEKLVRQNPEAVLKIDSEKKKVNSRQLVAGKKAENAEKTKNTENAAGKMNGKMTGKIIVCAHMDSKYGTAGALDNAAGVAVLYQTALKLNGKIETGNEKLLFDIDFVPFNGEEYYEASGEMKYLEYLENNDDRVKLVINIDAPSYVHSETEISSYNLDEKVESMLVKIISKYETISKGQEWFAGDHAAFAFQGVPCLAVTSSNMEKWLELTHTTKDTLENVDLELIETASDFLVELICSVQKLI
ncbi:hypothetical protein MsAg5_08890 [Methanosarcinaceae archaeon Ag5]|uniref:Carboxypeptidase Q n=2 Tax=Methanolapillus africanus TaxID=3028297 RepID=A0AAE4MJK6_9EURY|nr:hypothetical protein [Methanosarcinaceae archaeon Ag5]